MSRKTSVAAAAEAPAATSPKKAFDLSERYAAEFYDVPILDPANLSAEIDTGIRIGIRSIFSREARQANERARAPLQLVGGEVQNTEEEIDDSFLEQTIAVTARWSSGPDYPDTLLVGGEALPCTPANVRALYTDPRTAWIQKQVQRAYLESQHFFSKPKTA